MKLAHITIMVKNLEESIDFYQNIIGLPIADRFQAGPDQEIVFLGEGETLIELIYNRKLEKVKIGQDISIGFSVDNLDETIEFVKGKDIEFLSEVIQPNDLTRFFFVLDPNGVKVQFIEQKNIA